MKPRAASVVPPRWGGGHKADQSSASGNLANCLHPVTPCWSRAIRCSSTSPELILFAKKRSVWPIGQRKWALRAVIWRWMGEVCQLLATCQPPATTNENWSITYALGWFDMWRGRKKQRVWLTAKGVVKMSWKASDLFETGCWFALIRQHMILN